MSAVPAPSQGPTSQGPTGQEPTGQEPMGQEPGIPSLAALMVALEEPVRPSAPKPFHSRDTAIQWMSEKRNELGRYPNRTEPEVQKFHAWLREEGNSVCHHKDGIDKFSRVRGMHVTQGFYFCTYCEKTCWILPGHPTAASKAYEHGRSRCTSRPGHKQKIERRRRERTRKRKRSELDDKRPTKRKKRSASAEPADSDAPSESP